MKGPGWIEVAFVVLPAISGRAVGSRIFLDLRVVQQDGEVA